MRKTIPIQGMLDYANDWRRGGTHPQAVQTTVYEILQNANIPCKMYASEDPDGSIRTYIKLEEK